jgi:leucyl-tRNA synthetase
MAGYEPAKIEAKWQKKWEKEGVYEPDLKNPKKPFYNLMMFPYPSAEGLHIGGVRTFTGVDIYGRYKRMTGYDVFQPIGLDGFGINAENYALKIGVHPLKHSKVTEKNFYRQLRMIGNGFSWKEKLETYDPNYYKWTQWIFTQMFKWGLAYRKKQAVNWCPVDKTVLANEQVISGKCERCGSAVEKKELEQWFFKITEYADRLDKNLDKLDWSPIVKTAQRNWIGKSEGAEIDFMISQSQHTVTVFTTRPDTLFGATYLVLAPEHPLVEQLRPRIQNWKEVEKYVSSALAKPDEDRLAEGREKTGVELAGVKAMNPATREAIPVWVADYVLGSYGTGAIMAVPAHDERDFAFAKKFDLPIVTVVEPVTGERRPNEEFRRSIVAVVENPKTKKYLSLNWGQAGGSLFIGGGIEGNENPAACALREIAEETGYQKLKLVSQSETVHHHYVAHSKGVNRLIDATGLHFTLEGERKGEQKLVDDEKGKFKVEWLSAEEVEAKVKDELHKYVFDRLVRGRVYSGAGVLTASDKFTDMDSEKAKDAIVKFVGGRKKTQYRLRDWLLSRQRYWGPPIPMIHCDSCAAQGKGERPDMPGWYAVPAKDLPVKLPNVAEFRPTGTDQSPLATVASFHKVKCPRCKAWARRETDVSDTFLDSAWYFLRYPSAKDSKRPWNPSLTKEWLPVYSYIGGAEHSVLHLLYSRFLTMVLRDKGHLTFEEPFTQFRAHGLITKDGAKMSKSKGNVVNPDEYWKAYGTDVMRMYLAFMAPLDQGGDFREGGIVGLERFLARVWKLATSPRAAEGSDAVRRASHRTVKKVGEDIEDLKYNTAISALMVMLSELEAHGATEEAMSVFTRLLAPFAPFMAEEIWREALGRKGSIHREDWPQYDPRLLEETTFTLVVQVNGKLRDSITVPAGITESDAKAQALASEKVQVFLDGKEPARVIYIPQRLVNIVL